MIAALLHADTRRWFELHVIETTASTNSDLLRDAARLPSGSVLVAEHQTAGRGRRGRTWIAPTGGSLTFSLLWKFRCNLAKLSGLSLAIGVGAARALEQCGVTGVHLKWPNDLLARRSGDWCKLGGILVEVTGESAGTVGAVIGIGLNLDLGQAAAGIDQPVTDLRCLGGVTSRNVVLAALLTQLAAILPTFSLDGFAPLAAEWNRRHAWAGERVQLAPDNGLVASVAGVARGVADDGALQIETPTGVTRIVSGDVSLRVV